MAERTLIVDLHLREQCNGIGRESPTDVSTAVSTRALYPRPVLDAWHDHVNTLAQEVIHILTLQRTRQRNGLIGPDTKLRHALLCLVHRRSHARDTLHQHTRNMQMGRVFNRTLDHCMHGHGLDLRDVVPRNLLIQQTQDVGSAGSTLRTPLVVGRAVVPFAEPLCARRRDCSRRLVGVGQGQEVGGDGRLVGLLEAREGEGTRDEETGGGV